MFVQNFHLPCTKTVLTIRATIILAGTRVLMYWRANISVRFLNEKNKLGLVHSEFHAQLNGVFGISIYTDCRVHKYMLTIYTKVNLREMLFCIISAGFLLLWAGSRVACMVKSSWTAILGTRAWATINESESSQIQCFLYKILSSPYSVILYCYWVSGPDVLKIYIYFTSFRLPTRAVHSGGGGGGGGGQGGQLPPPPREDYIYDF